MQTSSFCFQAEDGIRAKVTHEDQVNKATEDQPGVVLERGIFELVILGNLGLEFLLEELVQPRARLVAGGRVDEKLPAVGSCNH